MGARFWLGLSAIVIGGGIAAMIFFIIFSAAWYAWGAVGALVFGFAVLALVAWVLDRRAAGRSTTV